MGGASDKLVLPRNLTVYQCNEQISALIYNFITIIKKQQRLSYDSVIPLYQTAGEHAIDPDKM